MVHAAGPFSPRDILEVFRDIFEWFKLNPTYGAILTTLATAVISGLSWALFKIGHAISAVFRVGFVRYSSRMRLVKIARDKRKEINEFFLLYEAAFKEEERFSTIEILEWLRGKAKAAKIDYRLLVVLKQETPVAIGIYMRCKPRRVIF